MPNNQHFYISIFGHRNYNIFRREKISHSPRYFTNVLTTFPHNHNHKSQIVYTKTSYMTQQNVSPDSPKRLTPLTKNISHDSLNVSLSNDSKQRFLTSSIMALICDYTLI